MRRTSVRFSMLGIAAAGLGLALAWPWLASETAGSDASAATIALGKTHYAKRCASCHGARLEGQPNWKRPLPSGRMPAPPHDASGHTWHHPDSVLFRITREGPAAVVGGGYQSDMPGFGNVMSDDDIRAVLSFIKSTWPERERQYQVEMSRREREKTQ
ncbi:cytochrome C [Phyllobacterium brassicacearum]|uniref:Cytochrome C n=1 Tax=Phyllobacterium brassicacearum TaxID=314235 RepID=A0A2P7BCW0_9HYPH|nr:cytochrome c [Phyllobacterium brassicacearum]PSH63302.1 cytochrome C [Phyllobacterium brassicacearum]PSH64286.1 cytochrome C [Phyllobacterium brassicacearum]